MKPLNQSANLAPEVRPSPSPTTTPTPGTLIQSAMAEPNISHGEEPIHILLTLRDQAHVTLGIFTVMGERLYEVQAEGNQGTNTLAWDIKNNLGGHAASGLYLYVLTADDGVNRETRIGKIALIH